MNNYTSSHQSRLQLNLLPLMYIYELSEIMFLIKSLNMPISNFEIRKYMFFHNNTTIDLEVT